MHDLVSDTIMYNSLKGTLLQLRSSSSSLVQFTTNLKTVSDRLKQKDNPVGVLLNDSAAALYVKSTLINLDLASHKLDEDLEALQHNFLFRGFFRKRQKALEKAKVK